MTGAPVIAQRLSGGPLALDKIAKQLDAVGVYEENPRTLVRAHAVIAIMGDTFVLLRLDSTTANGRMSAGSPGHWQHR